VTAHRPWGVLHLPNSLNRSRARSRLLDREPGGSCDRPSSKSQGRDALAQLISIGRSGMCLCGASVLSNFFEVRCAVMQGIELQPRLLLRL
jgi:hypothetical protein